MVLGNMMFGVVLWSDGKEDRAVIWCEDHGDLAYFNASKDLDAVGIDLDPGDLVQFEVRECGQMRLAQNPRLVAEDQYPSLAHRLRAVGQGGDSGLPRGDRSRQSFDQPIKLDGEPRGSQAIVVPFKARSEKSRRRAAGRVAAPL